MFLPSVNQQRRYFITTKIFLITMMKKTKSDLEIPVLELDHLTEHQQKVAREFLQKHSGMFASGQSSGRTNIVRHRINTGDGQSIRQAGTKNLACRRYRGVKQSIVFACSASHHTRRVDAILRRLHKINDVTKKDNYPIPRI